MVAANIAADRAHTLLALFFSSLPLPATEQTEARNGHNDQQRECDPSPGAQQGSHTTTLGQGLGSATVGPAGSASDRAVSGMGAGGAKRRP